MRIAIGGAEQKAYSLTLAEFDPRDFEILQRIARKEM